MNLALNKQWISLYWGLFLLVALVACAPATGSSIEVERQAVEETEEVPVLVEDESEVVETVTAVETPSATPTMLPTPTPAPTVVAQQPSQIIFVEAGHIKAWYPEQNSTETVYESGDVIGVVMREDGQKLAFIKRIAMPIEEDADYDRPIPYEQASLWVMDMTTHQVEEILSNQALGQLFSTEGDFAPYDVVWVANTDVLLFSKALYSAVAEGMSHGFIDGVYRVDIQTKEPEVLSQGSESFVLSPDGSQIAVLSSQSIGFMNSDGSDWQAEMLTYGKTDMYFGLTARGVWQTNGESFVLVAPATNIDFSAGVDGWRVDWNVWRIQPADASTELLTTLTKASPRSIAFSPQGDQLIYQTNEEDSARYDFVPLTADMGALTMPRTTYPYNQQMVSWQPDGVALVYADDDPYSVAQLCPNTTQIDDVCGQLLQFDASAINYFVSLMWVDASRFLLVTADENGQTLWVGDMDGSLNAIATDPAWGYEWPYYQFTPFDAYIN